VKEIIESARTENATKEANMAEANELRNKRKKKRRRLHQVFGTHRFSRLLQIINNFNFRMRIRGLSPQKMSWIWKMIIVIFPYVQDLLTTGKLARGKEAIQEVTQRKLFDGTPLFALC
jgi:hypothetical protein